MQRELQIRSKMRIFLKYAGFNSPFPERLGHLAGDIKFVHLIYKKIDEQQHCMAVKSLGTTRAPIFKEKTSSQ